MCESNWLKSKWKIRRLKRSRSIHGRSSRVDQSNLLLKSTQITDDSNVDLFLYLVRDMKSSTFEPIFNSFN